MGTPDFAVPSLGRIAGSRHDCVCVVTRPDTPKGRGQKLSPSPVKLEAQRLNIPTMQPENLKDPHFHSALSDARPDLFVVVAFRILPLSVLMIPRLCSLNLHASILPKYRGAAPINWAIINGEKETGLTTFVIDEKVDTGDIILQEKVEIGDDETAGELYNRLKAEGADLLVETIDLLEAGKSTRIPQSPIDSIGDKAGATKAPKIKKENGRIDWNKDPETIRNLIRGTNPYPGAFTTWRDKELKIHRAAREERECKSKPGEIIVSDPKDGIVVATGGGFLRLLEVQPAGKKKMTASEFVRGYRLSQKEKFE